MNDDEQVYYWTIDGVPACASPHTWGPDFDPPFHCAGTRKQLEHLVFRFHGLRPGHEVRIHEGRCPESGRGSRHWREL